jgi:hypothetical protein
VRISSGFLARFATLDRQVCQFVLLICAPPDDD